MKLSAALSASSSVQEWIAITESISRIKKAIDTIENGSPHADDVAVMMTLTLASKPIFADHEPYNSDRYWPMIADLLRVCLRYQEVELVECERELTTTFDLEIDK